MRGVEGWWHQQWDSHRLGHCPDQVEKAECRHQGIPQLGKYQPQLSQKGVPRAGHCHVLWDLAITELKLFHFHPVVV